jgi:hypothetical protein
MSSRGLKEKKKNPIKERPLPVPGQSLEARWTGVLVGPILLWYMGAALLVILAGAEWVEWWQNSPHQPIPMTVLAIIAVALAAWQIRKCFRKARHMGLGLDGERAVGQQLETLRNQGYEIFHDIPGDGYNIDHVVIGPGGVFVIETKTRSKPVGRNPEISYDGKVLRIDGHARPDPIVQVRAASGEMDRLIRAWLGRSVEIRPILVFPGWFCTQPNGSPIWVHNEQTVVSWISTEFRRMSDTDVRHIASALSTHVRQKMD